MLALVFPLLFGGISYYLENDFWHGFKIGLAFSLILGLLIGGIMLIS